MTLLFVEGFGSYETGSHDDGTAGDDMFQLWTRFNSITITTYETGSAGYRNYMTRGGADATYANLALSTDKLVVGFLFYNDSNGTAIELIDFNNSANNFICGIGKNSTGQLLINNLSSAFQDRSANPDSVTQYTSSVTLAPGAWSYIEVAFTASATSGGASFWVNNLPAGSWSLIDTIDLSPPIIGIELTPVQDSPGGWTSAFRITDLYIDSDTRHGPIKVWYQPADLTGSFSQFTPSSGSNNANMVKEIESDEDSTYNESDISGSKDSFRTSYQITEIPIAIQNLIWAKSVSGSSNLVAGTISDPAGGAYYGSGSTVGLNTGSYQAVNSNILETDPSASAAWTVSRVNTAEIYYQRG